MRRGTTAARIAQRLLIPMLLGTVRAWAAATPDPAVLDKVTVSAAAAASVGEDGLSTSLSAAEIRAYGDKTVGALLRRLPGVSLDESGPTAVRLRGLAQGYSRIYVNGEPLPQGATIDAIPVETIERIIYLKAPGSSFSAQGIAGIINIITYSGLKAFKPEFRLSTSLTSGGRPKPDANLRFSAWSDTSTQLGIALGASESVSVRSATIRSWTDGPAQPDEALTSRAMKDRLRTAFGTVNLVHRWDTGATFRMDPRLSTTKSRSDIHDDTVIGQTSLRELPAASAFIARADRADWSLPASLGWLSADGSRSRMKAELSRSELDVTGDGQERYPSLQAERTKRLSLSRTQDEARWTGQRSWESGERWTWSAGAELSQTRLSDRQSYVAEFVPDVAPRRSDDTAFHLTARQLAGFAEGTASLRQSVDVTAGLRFEHQRLAWHTDGIERGERSFHVLAPSLRAVLSSPWSGADSVSASLRRSIRYPTADQLSPRIVYSAQNSVSTPDRIGNPNLRPEAAESLDLSAALRPTASLRAQVTLYYKWLHNYLGTKVWDVDGNWIGTPVNRGEGRAHGLEATASWKQAALGPVKAVQLRGELSWNNGRATLPSGRSTALDGQPRYSGKFSGEGSWGGSGWSGGATLTMSGRQRYLDVGEREVTVGARAFTDAFLVYTVSGGTRWRLSITPLWSQDQRNAAQIELPDHKEGQERRTRARSTLQLQVSVPL